MTSKPQGSILHHEQSVGSTSNESSAPVNSQISRYQSRPTDNELSDDRRNRGRNVRPSVAGAAYNVTNYASRNAAGTVTKEGFCLTDEPSNVEKVEGERGKTLNASLNPKVTSSIGKSNLSQSKTNFYSAEYHHQPDHTVDDIFISQNDNSNIGSEQFMVSMYV